MTALRHETERYEKRFGVTAVELGFITADQLVAALKVQVREDLEGGKHRLLGQILREMGLMSPDEVERVLRHSLRLKAVGA